MSDERYARPDDEIPDLPGGTSDRAMRAVWAHLAQRPEDRPLLAAILRGATAVGFTQWEAAADLLNTGAGWEAVVALINEQGKHRAGSP
jgi:hypothetical protein